MDSMTLRFVEPVPRMKMAGNSAVHLARRIWHFPGRFAIRKRLGALANASPAGDPRPSFGWLEDPERADETRIGGGVKLLHLRAAFGEHRSDFNVLYLVSSILHLIPQVEEVVAFAKSRGIPVVWNQNGVAYPSWCGDAYPWFNLPMRRLIHQADHVFYQSAFCQSSADRYLGAVAVPSEILWNPVDLEHFSDERSGTRVRGGLRLLAMGTNHAFYRVRSSLDCLAALIARGVDVHLTIAGELRWPGADDETRSYVKSRGLEGRVTFLPRFSQAEAPAIYRTSDILLHPKYKDPCPTVPIEAMACGLPVVGTASGGMPELVPPSVGRLVSVPDDWSSDHAPEPTAMADAVEAVASDLAAMRSAARNHACASFDRNRWVQRHDEVFRRLVAPAGGRIRS
jgi:glycosyltransferase involved in cell wall biosynthesis